MKASIASVEKKESKINAKHEKLARALKLQGMAESTIKCYLRGFRRVCEYFNRLPDYLLVSEFEQWFLMGSDRNGTKIRVIKLKYQCFKWNCKQGRYLVQIRRSGSLSRHSFSDGGSRRLPKTQEPRRLFYKKHPLIQSHLAK
jgi:hypothetical protein